MNLCPRDRCKHYGDDEKYGKKCYYEPQCWRGILDMMFQGFTLMKKIRKELRAENEGRHPYEF